MAGQMSRAWKKVENRCCTIPWGKRKYTSLSPLNGVRYTFGSSWGTDGGLSILRPGAKTVSADLLKQVSTDTAPAKNRKRACSQVEDYCSTILVPMQGSTGEELSSFQNRLSAQGLQLGTLSTRASIHFAISRVILNEWLKQGSPTHGPQNSLTTM